MDGVVVEQEKTEHVRGDFVDAAVLELGFVNICFILTPVFVRTLLFRSARASCTTSVRPVPSVRAKNLDPMYTGIYAS